MFKNLIVYRIGVALAATLPPLEEALSKDAFVECGATQERSIGWTPPRGVEYGPLLESVGGEMALGTAGTAP